jgi:hypothetical protein
VCHTSFDVAQGFDMMKTVPFKMPATTTDDWVTQRHDPELASRLQAEPTEPTKRLIIDLPVKLHKRLKLDAVERGQTIGNVIRELNAREFPD